MNTIIKGTRVRILVGNKTKNATGTVNEVTESYLGVKPYLWITLDTPVALSSGLVKEVGRSTNEVERI